MKNKGRRFQKLVLDWLEGNRKRLAFAKPVPGRGDDLLALVPVEGLGAGIQERVLVIARRGNGISIECRFVLSIGSAGEQANRTAAHLFRKLFLADCEEIEELTDDQWDMMGLLVEQYRIGRRQVDDLIAHVILGSNDATIWTKAGIDWRDGRVTVAMAMECDFESLPDLFEDAVVLVLQHAQCLIRMERLVRRRLTPEPPLPETVLKRLDWAFAQRARDGKADTEKQEDEAEGEAMML